MGRKAGTAFLSAAEYAEKAGQKSRTVKPGRFGVLVVGKQGGPVTLLFSNHHRRFIEIA